MRVLSSTCLLVLAATATTQDIWVQSDYSGTSTGSSSQPYKHIYDVVNIVKSGDTVRVRSGTYTDETVWLRSGVTYRSDVYRGAKIVGRVIAGNGVFHYWGGSDASDSGANIWNQRTPISNVTIDGFEITYPLGTANNVHGVSVTWAHHISIVNNWIHDIPGAGVQSSFCDYVTVDGNKVNDCAWWQQSLCFSGIGLWKTQPWDSNAGFHNQIRKNYVRHNYNYDGGSDGNGIIIDTTRWDKGTLVENNVVWDNGSSGIMLDAAWNVTVRYNTLFMNSWRLPVPEIYAQKVDWDSGQWNADCYNVQVYGNLISTRLTTLAVKLNANTNNSYAWGNLRWHETSGTPQNVPYYWRTDYSGTDTGSTNDVTANPLFVNRQWSDSANFRLNSTSPARDRLSYNTSDGKDMDWFTRVSLYDLGAFEYH